MTRFPLILATCCLALGPQACRTPQTTPTPPDEPQRPMPIEHPVPDTRIRVDAPPPLDTPRTPWVTNTPPPGSPPGNPSGTSPQTSPQSNPATPPQEQGGSPTEHVDNAQPGQDGQAQGQSQDQSQGQPPANQPGHDSAQSDEPGSGSTPSPSGQTADSPPSPDQSAAQAPLSSSSGSSSGQATGEPAELLEVGGEVQVPTGTAADPAQDDAPARQEDSGGQGEQDQQPGDGGSSAPDHTDVSGVIEIIAGPPAGDADVPAWLTRPGANPTVRDDARTTPTNASQPGQGGGESGVGTGAARGAGATGTAGANEDGGSGGADVGDPHAPGDVDQDNRTGEALTGAAATGDSQETQQGRSVVSPTDVHDTPDSTEPVTLGGLTFPGRKADERPTERRVDDLPIADDPGETPEPPPQIDLIAEALTGTWRMIGDDQQQPADFAPAGGDRRYIGIDPQGHRLIVLLAWGDDAQLVMSGEFQATFGSDMVEIVASDDHPSRFPAERMTLPGGGVLEASTQQDSWSLAWSRTDDALRIGSRVYVPVDPAEVDALRDRRADPVRPGPGTVPRDTPTASIDTDTPSVDFFGVQSEGHWVCFVVDRSGSMSERGKMKRLREELHRTINALDRDVSFAVVFFSGDAKVLVRGWTAADTPAAHALLGKLGGINPAGGTDPGEAFTWAMTRLDPPPDTVFFMTDGQVATTNLPSLLRRLNSSGARTRIHTIGFGNGADEALLKQIAREHGGVYTHVR